MSHSRPNGHQNTTIDIAPDDNAILFNATGRGGRDIYVLNLSDLSVAQVTNSRDYEVTPSFSPDGTQIVYAAGVPGDRADHIFVMSLDGKARQQLTAIDANDTDPKFSPDGFHVVFTRDKSHVWGGLAANWDETGVICIVKTDGTGEQQLTPDEESAHSPSFSKDGKSIRYFTPEGQFSVPADGSSPATRIGTIKSGNFSLDRNRIVFSYGEYSPDCEVFVADADESNRLQITRSKNGCFHGVFSSNNEKIYFLMEEWPNGYTGAPKSSLWVVNADGTNQKQLTDLSLFDAPTKWKPKKAP